MTLLHFIVQHPLIDGFLVVSVWLVYRLIKPPTAEKLPIQLPEQDYGTPCITVRGEHVRSMAECFIANYLNMRRIEYVYEERFLIKAEDERIRVFPDFYLPEFDLLVEYWGLLDCKPEYEQEMRRKMALYHRNQIQFISIYPSNLLYPFDPVDFDKLFRYKFQQVTGTALRALAQETLMGMPQCQMIRRLESRRVTDSAPK